ncbi:MAG TPA: thioredoxin [Bacteroidetes bacterium]|nr:thioredoxin [Bacteroidota bacterium]
MKNLLIIFTFSLLLGSNAFAQDGIKFDKIEWKELLSKAKKENKLIFVDAYASWCGPCKKMERDVFSQKQVGDYYNAHFINAKIDMEKGEGPGLSNSFGIMAYPTLLFVNSSGDVVHRSVGYHSTDLLLELGEAALDPARNMGSIESKYADGDRSPELLYNLAIAKLDAYDGTHAKVAEEYLATQKDWNKKINMEFIYRMVGDLDSKMAQHIINNKKAYEEQLGERAISAKIIELVQDKVAKAENEGDLKSIENLYAKIYPNKADEMAGRLKIGYYAQKENWKGFAKAANSFYKKYPPKSWDELNEYAWLFYEEAKGKKELKRALKWAKKSVSMDSNYYNNDTLAALYYRLGKKGKALATANKAIALAEAAGEDHASTDALLEEIKNM